MEYPKVCLRRGEESGVLKGQRLIYDNELDWADDICADGCVVAGFSIRTPGWPSAF